MSKKKQQRPSYFRGGRWRLTLITLITLVLSMSLSVRSADSTGALSPLPIKKLTTCVLALEQWGEFDQQTATFSGIYPEIFKEFSKRSGIQLELILAPYPRLVRMLLSRQGCELTISLPSQALLDNARIGINVWHIKLGIISKPEARITYYEQLEGLNIGLLRSAKITPQFDADTSFNKITSVEFSNLLAMLELDRIDAIAGDIEIINSLISQDPSKEDQFATPLLLGQLPLHVIYSEHAQHQEQFAAINAIFEEMKNDGTIKNIIYRHLEVLDKPQPQ